MAHRQYSRDCITSSTSYFPTGTELIRRRRDTSDEEDSHQCRQEGQGEDRFA